MSNTLFFLQGNDHEQMVRWGCAQIPWMAYNDTIKAVAIGNTQPDGSVEHLAVCMFHGYFAPTQVDFKDGHGPRSAGGVCEISFAAVSPRWATRGMISSLLHIPFVQYKCRKVVTVIPSSNTRAIEFNKGIGLKWEASLRHHFARGVHAQVHGMMRSEWEARWKDPRNARIRTPARTRANGQKHLVASPA